jgi:hypothetical protein
VYGYRTVTHEDAQVQCSERERRTENLARMDGGDDGQPSLHPTVTTGFHPWVASMHQSRRIWRTTAVNVVVYKRSQRRQWRLLPYHPRRDPRLGQRLNYCPLEDWRVGDGPDWVPVELKDALAEDVDTPDVPTIAPGPYSGFSL